MVIFIICLILSLVLPAIQSGREAARRVQCINNLKQIGLALANYETHHTVLPPGVVDRAGPISNEPSGLHIGWIVQLLPYIEQQAVYKSFDNEASVYAPENHTVRMTRINMLLCPSDIEPGKTISLGMTSYAACHHDVEAPIDVSNHGVFVLNSHIRADDVLDGLSFTVFVGEKPTEAALQDLGWLSGSRASLRNTGTVLNQTPPVNVSGFLPSSAVPSPGGEQELAVGGFGSHHPGGANFSFGDGSVRFLSNSISSRVYRCLGHLADGEMISNTEF